VLAEIDLSKILKKLDLPGLSTFAPASIDHARKILDVCNQIENERARLLSLYKCKRFDMKLIAEESGISCRTIYNYQEIKTLIDALKREQASIDIFQKITNLENKVKELNEQIKMLNKRDVEIEELQKQLKLAFKDVEAAIAAKQKANLRIDQLLKIIEKDNSKVISFKHKGDG